MKKRMSAMICVLVLLSMLTVLTVACNKDGFKINFYDGDSIVNSISTKGKEAITLPTDPVKAGYTFEGWFFEKEFTNQLLSNTYEKTKLKAEANVYAKWKALDNTVAFNANTGAGEMASIVAKTDAVVKLTANAFAKDGYTFAGWALSADGAVVYADGANYKMGTASVTLYAVWTANDNTVTFKANGGTGTMANQTIKSDATLALTPNAFTKTGYTFAGWALSADGAVVYADGANYAMSTSGATLYAVWTANDNTVTFYANYGTTDKESQTIKTNVTATLRLNTFVNTGYTFAGWALSADGAVAYADGANYAMSTSGTTLYAVWTANDNTVTFYANYGTTDKESQTIKTNVTATLRLNTFVNIGYTFAGWATTEDGANVYADGANYKMGTASVTLYAVWTANDNTVTFKANGGTGTMANQTIKSDATLALTPNAFTKTGYTFAGWATTEDGANVYADGANYKMGTASVTLYAVWTINTYTINFNYDGAGSDTSIQTMQTTYNTAFNCPMPRKTDYVFQGWYDGTTQITDNLGASIVTLTGKNDKVFNLKAKWALQTEGMEFSVDGKTLTKYTGTAQYVVIPDTVTSIGASAFSDTKLTSIDIPNSVTSIGYGAFYWCLELTKVTIGSGVASIGNRAFESCYKLASITVDTSNPNYKGTGNCLVDTSTKTLIAGCNNSVIPTDGSVTSIGNTAFYGFSGLKEVIIPSTVTSIGDSAFTGCGMTSIAIPDSVTSIGTNAFYNCGKLTRVTIGSGVTSIGNTVFFGCRELASITVAEGNTTYKSAGNCLIERATSTLIAGCKSSVIPTDGSVTKIGTGAFNACYGLTSFTIPSGVTSIGEDAFRNCTGLTSIIIPDSVTSIGKSAFYSCGWLTSITIGSGVKSIGSFAFNDCRRLTTITIPASVTTVGDNAFNKCDSLLEINCGVADPTPEAQPAGWNANWKGNCTVTPAWGYTGA